MTGIKPCLWFDGNADEASAFYRGIFPDFAELEVSRTSEGKLLATTIQLLGQKLMLLNGGPAFSFTPATSLFLSCDTQPEVDNYWDRLLEGGGKPSRCGWLTDRFGLSWQIVPVQLRALLGDPDPVRAGRVMQAMLGMVRLDIAALEEAHAG